jgi:hypothetical protein
MTATPHRRCAILVTDNDEGDRYLIQTVTSGQASFPGRLAAIPPMRGAR